MIYNFTLTVFTLSLKCCVLIRMLNKNTLGVKKVRGQSEAALQIGTYVQPKTLISVEAKKLLIKNLLE